MQQLSEQQAANLLFELNERKTAYQTIFADGPAAREVILDLARFCRADETCFRADPREHAALEGRREVWLRIQNYLKLPPEDLLQRIVGDTYEVVKLEPKDENDG